MADADRPTAGPAVLTPDGALLANGSAEQFEQDIQALFAEGHRQVVVDLTNVPHMDSSGIRALVRGHTSAERVGGSFVVVAPTSRVARLLAVTRLDTILTIRAQL
jgi:anti-anti-sigma factor